MGGGIPEARVLFSGLVNTSSGITTAPSMKDWVTSVPNLDLDAYDVGVFLALANANCGNCFAMHKDIADGRDNGSFRFTKQSDGLWTVSHRHGISSYNDSHISLIVGVRTVKTTKTTEVSTMSISNAQPISAGNLKAALDGLTGGVAPEL